MRVISLLVLIILSQSPAAALEDHVYEEYCFSGLVYQMGEEQAEELRVSSFEDFLDGSEVVMFADTPIRTLGLLNEYGKKEVKVLVRRDVIEGSENVDMLFYYTDVYDDDYKFFGCAITSNNLSLEGLTYDTVIAVLTVPENSTTVWNTSLARKTALSTIYSIFSSPVSNTFENRVEKVVINDVTFNILKSYIDKSSIDEKMRWHANLTLLIPYVEELPGKRSWDDFIEFRSTDLIMCVDKDVIKDIKEDETTSVEIQDLEPTKPVHVEFNYLFISRVIVAILVIILILYLIWKKKQELGEWRGEDEYE